MSSMYIRFLAPITPRSAEDLLGIVDSALKEKCKEVHLMISSPGGSVLHGISLYNYIKGLPFTVYTYNLGSVDSVGVALFCAGTYRYCVPNGRFLIHPVQASLDSNVSLDEKKTLEILKGLEIDQYNIAKIISDTIKIPHVDLYKSMTDRLTLNSEESLKYGLIDDIKEVSIPLGEQVYSVSG